MNNFLNSQEIFGIRKDFEQILCSPEATDITLEWYTWANDSSSDVDPVYGVEDRQRTGVITKPIRALQQIVRPMDLEVMSFGILEEGDSIFYISKKINLSKPDEVHEVVKESLIFIDPTGIRWEPILKNIGPKEKHLISLIGNDQISQVIPAKIEEN